MARPDKSNKVIRLIFFKYIYRTYAKTSFFCKKHLKAMLEIRPICENCGKLLPNQSQEAMICSFECTFCADCVQNILHNVCPNCGGGFEKRPVRPKKELSKHPAQSKPLLKPIDHGIFAPLRQLYKDIVANER